MPLPKSLIRHLKFPIIGTIDAMSQGVLEGATGLVFGTLKGLTSRKISNVSGFNGLMQKIGYGAGRAGVTFAKPIVKTGIGFAKNTPREILQYGSHLGRLTRTVGKGLFKEAGPNAVADLFGYEARALTGVGLVAGALGYGILQSAGDYDYNAGLRVAVNDMMDDSMLAVTPGSVNPSFTPVKSQKPINDFNATGDIPLALHQKRKSGYL